MAISNMQQPRQMYGLGSFVKKAFRGIKKIAKSPLGKAAILGGLGYGLGGGFSGAGFSKGQLLSRIGLGGFTNPMKGVDPGFQNALGIRGGPTNIFSKLPGFLKSMVPGTTGFSGKNLFMGLGATAVASPYLAKAFGKGPEEIVEEGR